MKVILDYKEIGQAIIEYLDSRGIKTDLNHIYLSGNGRGEYSAEIRNVNIEAVPKEGPYR